MFIRYINWHFTLHVYILTAAVKRSKSKREPTVKTMPSYTVGILLFSEQNICLSPKDTDSGNVTEFLMKTRYLKPKMFMPQCWRFVAQCLQLSHTYRNVIGDRKVPSTTFWMYSKRYNRTDKCKEHPCCPVSWDCHILRHGNAQKKTSRICQKASHRASKPRPAFYYRCCHLANVMARLPVYCESLLTKK